MTIAHFSDESEAVTFTDLSRNPKAVAARAAALGCLRITHRDAPDMVLTTAPVLLGRGRPLFNAIDASSRWRLDEVQQFSSGMVNRRYSRLG